MKSLIPVTAVLLLAAIASADLFELPEDKAPKSMPAKDALARLEGAQKRAKAEYDRAMAAAVKAAVEDLEKAKDQMMKAGQLDEANRIQAAIQAAKSGEGTSRPVGHWSFRVGSVLREIKIDASGAVSTIDGDKATASGKLQRDGEWWVFRDERLDRVRKLRIVEPGVMLVANIEGDARGPVGYSVATSVK